MFTLSDRSSAFQIALLEMGVLYARYWFSVVSRVILSLVCLAEPDLMNGDDDGSGYLHYLRLRETRCLN